VSRERTWNLGRFQLGTQETRAWVGRYAIAATIVAVIAALLGLAIAAVAAAHLQATTLAPRKPCATIHGPIWSQTINVTANSPKKKAQLRVIHGTGYYVYVDHLRCAWAGHFVSRLTAQRIPARLSAASPAAYVCRAGRSRWFRDIYNSDAVRRSLPPTSVGACSPEGPNAALALTFHTFWWTPAKPCRAFMTYACRG
jgi:hypothetical protein